MAETPEIEIALDPMQGANPVEWARSILWAGENIGTAKMTQKAAGSPARYIYWKWGRKHQQELLIDFVPKALSILDKNKSAGLVTGMEATENEEIHELELLLDAAVAEAGLT